VIRVAVICAVAAAPLPFGSIYPEAYVPLLAVAFATGIASWTRGIVARSRGAQVPAVPGAGPLLALHALVLLQLLPLPPQLLGWVSPGSYALHYIPPPAEPWPWFPITVYVPDTQRGLVFLAGMSLLYATVFRDFQAERWRRRLAWGVVGSGMFLTCSALVQAASPEPTKIYGLFRAETDWAVFGAYLNRNHFAGYMAMVVPLGFAFAAAVFGAYLNRNHFAGYMAMVVPLGFAFAAEAFQNAFRRSRGRSFWRGLGERETNALARRSAVAILPLVGLLATQSRGGIGASAASAAVFLALLRRRWQAWLVVALLALGGLLLVDLDAMLRGFETRGFNRLEGWRDMLDLVRFFPVFGVGLNAFGPAFRPYQDIEPELWYGEAHNDYLQILFDTGVVGAGLFLLLVARLLVAGARRLGNDPLTAGVLAGIAASAAHALVDFDWQIPANAATFVALVGLALAGSCGSEAAPRPSGRGTPRRPAPRARPRTRSSPRSGRLPAGGSDGALRAAAVWAPRGRPP